MQNKWPGRPELITVEALEAWMGALIQQIDTASGLDAICRSKQKKIDLQNWEFISRHMLGELMREHASRFPSQPEMTLDELRAELAELA
jgi:hypothetical protein